MEIKSRPFYFNKRIVLIASIVVIVCIVIVCVFIATGSDQRKLDSLLDMGDKYLSELDYEQAIVAYEAAIAIDPKCEEAYLALAEAHLQMGNYEAAVDVLGQGIGETNSAKLIARLEELSGTADGAGEDIQYMDDGRYIISEYDEDGKRIKSIEYSADDRMLSASEYDGNGNVVKYTHYFEDGTVDQDVVCEYDESGVILKRTTTWYKRDGSAREMIEDEREYNKLREVRRTNFDGQTISGSIEYYEFEHDADGNLVRRTRSIYVGDKLEMFEEASEDGHYETWYASEDHYYTHEYGHYTDEYGEEHEYVQKTTMYYLMDGAINHVDETEYAANGNTIKSVRYDCDLDGTRILNILSEYDEDGHRIKETYYYADGSLNTVEDYEYDKNGNIIKSIRYEYDEDEVSIYVINEYDENGNRIRATHYTADGVLLSYYISEYDEDGRWIKETSYNADGTVEWEEDYSD